MRNFNRPDLSAYADSLESQNDHVLGALIQTRDVLIPEAKAAYFERGNAATAAYEADQARIRQQKEEREAQMKAQQQERVIAFFMDIAQWARQASIAFQKEQEAKRKSSSNKRRASGSSSSVSSSTSGGGGGGNSREFLERHVAEWENKLKKAQESLEEAILIADNTGTWEAKNVVKSKENTVREYAEELQKYKDQLRAL